MWDIKEGGNVAKGKYEDWLQQDNLILLQGWARDGLTDEQIANNMGISKQTLYDWKKKYTDFSDALKKGKEVIDYQVENALLQKALSGDTGAICFWLKNRRSDKWRDKPVIDFHVNTEAKDDGLTKALKEEAERLNNGDIT